MTTYAILYRTDSGDKAGEPHTSRECAEASVSPFEGAMVAGIVEYLPEPVLGMHYAIAKAAA